MDVGAAETQRPCRRGFFYFLFSSCRVCRRFQWVERIGIVLTGPSFGGQAGDNRRIGWISLVPTRARARQIAGVGGYSVVWLLKQIKWGETLAQLA